MELTVGETDWTLSAGDCLSMRLNQPIVFHNPGTKAARYLVALTKLAGPIARLASPTALSAREIP